MLEMETLQQETKTVDLKRVCGRLGIAFFVRECLNHLAEPLDNVTV